MPGHRTSTRRRFLLTAAAVSSIAGCLGEPKSRPGVIDANDLEVGTNSSAKISVNNVENDNDKGLKISTDDTIDDGTATATLPVSIPKISESRVFIQTDVGKLDDDTEVEIQFHTGESAYRRVFIGNEYKDQEKGVLATDTGTGYTLQKDFQKLPSPGSNQNSDSVDLEKIEFVIRDGDFTASIWALQFIFDNRTVVIL